MPNGGSDCCGTCWFNRKNHGKAGFTKHMVETGLSYCEIRHFEIPDPFYTYCANHPHRSPERYRVPIGPIWIDRGEGREIWKDSPDGDDVRTLLLDLLARIKEQPNEEYPIGASRDEVVVWQLGELREQRAIHNLERIVNFDPRPFTGEPLRRPRDLLVEAAKKALVTISEKRQA